MIFFARIPPTIAREHDKYLLKELLNHTRDVANSPGCCNSFVLTCFLLYIID